MLADHAAAVAILGAVLNLLGLQWMAERVLPGGTGGGEVEVVGAGR